MLQKALRALVDQTAHGNNRKPRIELHRGQRIPGRGADKGLLELRMRDDSVAAAKRVPSWAPDAPISR